MKSHSLISFFALGGLLASGAVTFVLARPAEGQSKDYVVLKINGMDGKTTFKAIAEKDQETYKKGLEEDFAKAKKTHADEKKAFQKENPGKKFEKPEPQRPRVTVARRALKSLNEAQKAASELEKAESKNGKGEKAEKGEKGSEKGEKNGSKKGR